MVFIAELFWWFEIVKPEFVQPRDVQEFKDGEEIFFIYFIFFGCTLVIILSLLLFVIHYTSYYCRHIIIALKVVDLFFLSFLLTFIF